MIPTVIEFFSKGSMEIFWNVRNTSQLCAIFTFYMSQSVAQKGSEATRDGHEPGIGYTFQHFILTFMFSHIFCQKFCFVPERNNTRNQPVFKNVLDLRSNFFVIPTLVESKESTDIGFQSQHKLCFPTFIPKFLAKCNFFKTSKSAPSYEYFEPNERR